MIENQPGDPDQLIEQAMWQIFPCQGKVVLDLGAGTGFHIPRFHEQAAHIFAVEPHAPSRMKIMARCTSLVLERASVMTGSAESLWLPDQSIDLVHARFAYFFAPNCLPGLQELQRVIRPGGVACIIDNNMRRGTFAAWLRKIPTFAAIDSDSIDHFWADQGFALQEIASEWRFERRADLEAVVRIEFHPEYAEAILAEHHELSVPYVYNLYYRRYP